MFFSFESVFAYMDFPRPHAHETTQDCQIVYLYTCTSGYICLCLCMSLHSYARFICIYAYV